MRLLFRYLSMVIPYLLVVGAVILAEPQWHWLMSHEGLVMSVLFASFALFAFANAWVLFSVYNIPLVLLEPKDKGAGDAL